LPPFRPAVSGGTYLTQWGSNGSGDGQFTAPLGVAIDAAGDVFVADYLGHRVQKLGDASTAAANTSWGRIKKLCR
jgi:tripartite motif-containing protein 71